MSLLKRYQKKSNKSPEQGFTEYMTKSMNFAYSITKKYLDDEDEIQDAIQSTYIKAWKSFGRFDQKKSSFTTWLYSIIRNECLDRFRISSKKPQMNNELDLASHSVDESVISDNKEMVQNILNMAERLSQTQKKVFTLRDVQGLSIKEVSQETGLTEGSIKSNLHLARKNIKQWMISEERI